MTASKVTITIPERGLGASLPSPSKRICVIGSSTLGSNNVPVKYVKQASLIAGHGYGQGVEYAAECINAGAEVVFVKCATSTDTTPAVADATHTFTGTGTSVIDATGEAIDDFEFKLTVVSGGTIGTAADKIKIKVSTDGGLTDGGVVSLGAANTYLVPNTGVTITFAAGTLVAGDTDTFAVRMDTASATNITDALTAAMNLSSPTMTFGMVLIVPPMNSTILAAVKTVINAHEALNHFVAVLANHRKLNASGETAAQWQADYVSNYQAVDFNQAVVGFGYGRLTSTVTRRQHLRPVSLAIAMRSAKTKIAESAAYVDRGRTPFEIYDEAGVAITGTYDERITGTMDSERAATFISYLGRAGAYITHPLTLAGPGSDFAQLPNRRVMNEAARITAEFFTGKLNKDVRIDTTSGFILEADALDMEKENDRLLTRGLIKTTTGEQNASGVTTILSRTDDLLGGDNLNAEINIVPLGYIGNVSLTLSFKNPAQAIAEAAAEPAA